MTGREATDILQQGLGNIATERTEFLSRQATESTEFLSRLDKEYAQLILENVSLVMSDIVDARFAEWMASGKIEPLVKSTVLNWVSDSALITDGELHEAMKLRRQEQPSDDLS